MSWARLDDTMPDDEKIANLSDTAFRVYITAICYASRMLTDGRVPKRIAHQWAGRKPQQIMAELLPVLFHEAGDFCESEHCRLLCSLSSDQYLVHNYLKFNAARDKVLAERSAARQRMFGRRSSEHGRKSA